MNCDEQGRSYIVHCGCGRIDAKLKKSGKSPVFTIFAPTFHRSLALWVGAHFLYCYCFWRYM